MNNPGSLINEIQISRQSRDRAIKLAEGIDIRDVCFVALTIEIKGPPWMGDKKLHKGLIDKGFNSVVNLKELGGMVKVSQA